MPIETSFVLLYRSLKDEENLEVSECHQDITDRTNNNNYRQKVNERDSCSSILL